MRKTILAGLLAGVALAGASAVVAQEATQDGAPETTQDAAPEAMQDAVPGTAAPEEPAEEAAEYDASTVLATVDGTEITLGHVVALRQRLPEQYQGLPDETLMQGLVDQLVDQELLSRTVSEGADSDPLPVRLHLENERRAALAQQAVQQQVEAPVEDAEIEAAYDALVEGFEPQTEWNASHILVPTEEEAAELKAEIEGGADFAEVAREHSQDGAAAEGGSLGWFGPGRMVPEFEAAVRDIEPGAVAGPIQTQFGWHLITLNETRETEPPALEEVRTQLENQVRQERLNERVEALRAEAGIERPQTGIPPQAIRDDAILQD